MHLLRYFSIIAVIIVIGLCIRQGQPHYQTFKGNIFGTVYHIKVRTSQKDASLHDKIKAELALINAQMSVFETDSEVSQINRAPRNRKINLSENMSYLLRQAQTVYRQSEGAFDPTISPLIDAWGFGPDKQAKIPTRKQIKKILQYTGFNKLRFDKSYKTIRKDDERISLNLSAIAKGYGVDKIAELLEYSGYRNYVVEIGGEIRVSGFRDDKGTMWTVGISEPAEKGANAMVLDMTNRSVATSGDYRNYRTDENGKRYSHTISPQTGLPVYDKLASVTVFTKHCIDADAYATAMMSMGYDKALAFADKHKIAAIFFIHTEEGGFTKAYSASARKQMGE